MPARRFGKYEVLARLATGGAANIFLARQPGAAGFHKLVCLKTLLPERITDTDFVAMFLDEARLAARLNHPNCVQIYDLGRVRGTYYISMEYIFGETLWNLLATVTKLRTPLPTAHVASIVASVCDGLHHAHELKDSNGRPYNLVHRDVSPQNVMITYEGQTKVLDFGIAKAETGRAPTQAGIVKGKFSYMSPEQITGGAIDRRSDVYSLGIVLFECLASRRLYRGDSPEEIARLILEHRAPRLKDIVLDIPAALDAICATALSRHPSKRFQTAQEMGEALREYLDSIRYAHSAASLSRLIDERFKGEITERRKIFESALNGTQDEMHLLKVLDARAVRDIDLFPTVAEAASDFVESSAALDPSDPFETAPPTPGGTVRPVPEIGARIATLGPAAADIGGIGASSHPDANETIQGEDATGEVSPDSPLIPDGVPINASGATLETPQRREPSVIPVGLREGSGWRVEIGPSPSAPPQISVLGVSTAWDRELGTSGDETRIDGEEIPDEMDGLPGFAGPSENDPTAQLGGEELARSTDRPGPSLDDPTKVDLDNAGIAASQPPIDERMGLDPSGETLPLSKRTRQGSYTPRGTGVTVEPALARSGPVITRSVNDRTFSDQAGPDLSAPTPEDGTVAPPANGARATYDEQLRPISADNDPDYDKTIQQQLVEAPGSAIEGSVNEAATLMTSLADPVRRNIVEPPPPDLPPDAMLPRDEIGTEPKPFIDQTAPNLAKDLPLRPEPTSERDVPALADTYNEVPAVPLELTTARLGDSLAETSPSDIAGLLAAEGKPALAPSAATVPQSRVSVNAILVALGLGLVIGVVIGLLLARLFSTPATQILPVVREPITQEKKAH